jgi:hypothetical protein
MDNAFVLELAAPGRVSLIHGVERREFGVSTRALTGLG